MNHSVLRVRTAGNGNKVLQEPQAFTYRLINFGSFSIDRTAKNSSFCVLRERTMKMAVDTSHLDDYVDAGSK